MPIDAAQAMAQEIPPLTVAVERGRLAFFAKATGQDDPIYSDVAAAKAAGHPDLPVPPTFFFSLELEQSDPFAWITSLGVDLRTILHGEQSFTYHAMAYAGDELVLQPRIVDVTSKKGGALELVTKKTTITRGDDLIAEARTVLIAQNKGVS
ncbi:MULTISPECIES: MaoC family dehydratase N-terminal domain-containing protein [Thermocrispum]|uniref:MaoC family dehydratase N-terminal domain-containing protein n=2 Tax=Thermocrispum agreste TaxID=37925 RepID=A0ABD6FDC8_9PSEU|nr:MULTISPECIES: MaoC family dehydratase N-terminal domain-containing protein [Thermocrispum]